MSKKRHEQNQTITQDDLLAEYARLSKERLETPEGWVNCSTLARYSNKPRTTVYSQVCQYEKAGGDVRRLATHSCIVELAEFVKWLRSL